jgi:hypothetical protein
MINDAERRGEELSHAQSLRSFEAAEPQRLSSQRDIFSQRLRRVHRGYGTVQQRGVGSRVNKREKTVADHLETSTISCLRKEC